MGILGKPDSGVTKLYYSSWVAYTTEERGT
jgi:hypothetical protein